jgi:phosphohistidine phosphatase SixA
MNKTIQSRTFESTTRGMKPLFWVFTLVVTVAWCAGTAWAQQAIFLVRHADTMRVEGIPDVPLSEAGEQRAVALAALLKDGGINAIYTTNMQRTIKTAEPLVRLLRIEPKVVPQLSPGYKQNDIDNFVNLLRTEHRRDVVLLVLHSNSGPALIKALGYPAQIKIPETEFDNLFVVVPKSEGPPTLLRLRY